MTVIHSDCKRSGLQLLDSEQLLLKVHSSWLSVQLWDILILGSTVVSCCCNAEAQAYKFCLSDSCSTCPLVPFDQTRYLCWSRVVTAVLIKSLNRREGSIYCSRHIYACSKQTDTFEQVPHIPESEDFPKQTCQALQALQLIEKAGSYLLMPPVGTSLACIHFNIHLSISMTAVVVNVSTWICHSR